MLYSLPDRDCNSWNGKYRMNCGIVTCDNGDIYYSYCAGCNLKNTCGNEIKEYGESCDSPSSTCELNFDDGTYYDYVILDYFYIEINSYYYICENGFLV